jgi:hypothetical protein
MLNILYLLTSSYVANSQWNNNKNRIAKISNTFSSKTVARKDSTNDRGLPFILSGWAKKGIFSGATNERQQKWKLSFALTLRQRLVFRQQMILRQTCCFPICSYTTLSFFDKQDSYLYFTLNKSPFILQRRILKLGYWVMIFLSEK